MASAVISLTADENRMIVRIDGTTVDAACCDELTYLIRQGLQQRPRDVLIDCSRIKFLPSLAIGSLVALRREVGQTHHEMTLSGLSEHIRQALELCHLDKVFPLSPAVCPPADTAPAA